MPSYKGCIELSKLTQNQIWMLAVDGKRFQSENGPEGFERREPTSVNRIITVMNKMLSTASAEMSHIMRCLAGDVGLFYIPSGSDHMDLEVAAILDSYYTKIAQCGDNDDEKLALIATMIKELTRKHAFFDGNNRLFVNCMLLKMLCQNGFGPAILFDPNVFEFLSIAELVATIRQAIVETRQFIDSDDKTIYGVKLDTLHPDLFKKHELFANAFLQSILSSLIKHVESGVKQRRKLTPCQRPKLTPLYRLN